MQYQRTCPKCNKIVFSKSKRVVDEAVKKGRLCFQCAKVKYHTEEEKRTASNNRRKKCVSKKLGTFIRKCPSCGVDMIYNTTYELNRHNKKQTRCKSCAAKNKKFSEEHRKNLSKANTGKTHSDEAKRKMSMSRLGRKLSDETKKKIADGNRGKKYSSDNIKNMRLAALNRIHNNVGQMFPSYNPTACRIIEEYGKRNGYNFQHAENGGEFYIKELGYWVDGYDKEKNTVIEYYEMYHHKDKEQKDLQRQQQIVEHLNCKFIILRDNGYEISTDV